MMISKFANGRDSGGGNLRCMCVELVLFGVLLSAALHVEAAAEHLADRPLAFTPSKITDGFRSTASHLRIVNHRCKLPATMKLRSGERNLLPVGRAATFHLQTLASFYRAASRKTGEPRGCLNQNHCCG
jgi:hypothetical protein